MTTEKAPGKQAMEAAQKIYERVRSCSTFEGWVCDDDTETEQIAAALDDFATDMNDGDRTFKRLAQTERDRDALRERHVALVAVIRGSLDTGHSITEVRAALIAALAADAKAGEDR